MKKCSMTLLAMIGLLPLSAQTGSGLTTTHDESGYVPQGYQLDWGDEFDKGTELNGTDWTHEVQKSGWVNNELQNYVNHKTPSGALVTEIQDDHLIIRALKEDGKVYSGRVYAHVRQGWKYGYIEARIKLPRGKGTWPAFWMMPVNFRSWPADGEIDIMEEVGYHPDYVSSSLHANAHVHSNNTQVTHEMLCSGAESEYHVYGIEWTAQKITTYVDGKVQLEYANRGLGRDDWPYDDPFYVILNLAWGGSWGGAQGVDERALPAEMLVDYVRVYRKPAPEVSKKVVAYVTSWSSIMPDPGMMTHINYAFGGIGNDNRSVFADNASRLRQIVKLKERNPSLKVLLSVGGWGRGRFTPMAKDADNRKAFAASCAKFCADYGLDGIDIDWEFPGSNSSGEQSPSDERQNYTLLLRDLREALGDGLLLTMASQADPGHYDFKSCIQYLDFVNVMTYDMASPPQHHSALYRGGTVGQGWLVAHEGMQRHVTAGVPKDKLLMGLAFYGNGNGDGSGSANQVSLQEIEDGIASGKWIDHWDNVAKVPYVTNTSGKFVFGYDNARSLTLKCQYIVDNGYAGGMYWEYANDDNAGTERKTVYDCLIGNALAGTLNDLALGDAKFKYVSGMDYSVTLDLEQGRSYAITGDEGQITDRWYTDPDFFVRNDDGTFRFVPVSGRYQVTLHFNDRYFSAIPVDGAGNAVTYNPADGTGCVWVMGNDGIGKPNVNFAPNWGASYNWTPTADMFIPVPMVRPGVYQLTLMAGQQLHPTNVNFKFFHQRGYGHEPDDEFNAGTSPTRISTQSDLVRIDTEENGNVKLVPGKALTFGQTYVFTLDCSNPKQAVLYVGDGTTGIRGVDAGTGRKALLFDLQGRRVDSPAKGLYIRNGQKLVIR